MSNTAVPVRTLLIFLMIVFGPSMQYRAQTVVCETINTAGYNTKSESAYLQKISKEIQYGCGATWGKEIFYKNIHPNKTIKGFVVKKWKYSGYENYDVCEMHYFELKPGAQSNSLGCDHITQTQPCEFKPYGQFK
ncbi:MAG: hypothetical protein MUW56_22330 [Chryseobacterium sp.]|uniref:hypothetical protein n=1 Tax=Chryseobacterium sp. TaxID=1871047 RepID=UPI0025C4D1F3|nr:hypothetical protein [Chryseobacterium sp.]MCJ7936292.1 hypothetical protein [Chryseobacterium sp.]